MPSQRIEGLNGLRLILLRAAVSGIVIVGSADILSSRACTQRGRERERAAPGSILPKKPFPPEIESHLRRPDADPTLKETVCAIAKKREGNLEVAQVKTIGDGVGSGSSSSSPLFRYCHSVQKRQLHAMSFCFFFASYCSHLLLFQCMHPLSFASLFVECCTKWVLQLFQIFGCFKKQRSECR